MGRLKIGNVLKYKAAVLAVCMLTSAGSARLDEESVFTEVDIELVLPDGRNAVLLTVEGDENVSFFRNLNTKENYAYPRFVNCRGSMRVQKGVYLLGFDALADFGDGTVRRVRSASHRQLADAVYLIGDKETLVLKLTYLN